MSNKYNLKVGDKIRELASDNYLTISEIGKKGTRLNENLEFDTWEYINSKIREGFWKIVKTNTFPEKWAFKSDNEKEREQFVKWVDENKDGDNNFNGGSYSQSEVQNSYFHYPKWDNTIHTAQRIIDGYTPINFKQFKEHYLDKKPTMEKKIIGYKFKNEFEKYMGAVSAILQPHYDINIAETFRENAISKDYVFSESSSTIIKSYQKLLTDAGVLDLWFEPVYKASERKISVGIPSKEITINNKMQILFEGNNIGINFAESLRLMFMGKTQYPYIIYPRRLWIGCSEGTEVTKEEVENIITIYNELNP